MKLTVNSNPVYCHLLERKKSWIRREICLPLQKSLPIVSSWFSFKLNPSVLQLFTTLSSKTLFCNNSGIILRLKETAYIFHGRPAVEYYSVLAKKWVTRLNSFFATQCLCRTLSKIPRHGITPCPSFVFDCRFATQRLAI